MKRKKTNQPSALEVALQAQITSIGAAKTKLTDAIQVAEDEHYAAVRKAEQARHAELVAVEKVFDKAKGAAEKAWSIIFRRALKANFRDTGSAMREDRAAIADEALLQAALPFINKEIPKSLPGLKELVARLQESARQRRTESGTKLAEAHDNAAVEERKPLKAAKAKKEKAVNAAQRQLNAAKRPIEAKFRQAKRAADKQLRDSKAAAQLEFDQAGEARMQAWSDFQTASQTAEQALLASLQG